MKDFNKLNLYDRIIRAFIHEIHEYKPKLTVNKQHNIGQTPNYPYVSLLIYNDETQIGGNGNFPWFVTHIQMKALSDDENESKSLGFWLRHFIYKQQPLDDLWDYGIMPFKHPDALPNVDSFIQNSFQHVSGADVKIAVNYPIIDNTQPGEFDHINTNFKRKGR